MPVLYSPAYGINKNDGAFRKLTSNASCHGPHKDQECRVTYLLATYTETHIHFGQTKDQFLWLCVYSALMFTQHGRAIGLVWELTALLPVSLHSTQLFVEKCMSLCYPAVYLEISKHLLKPMDLSSAKWFKSYATSQISESSSRMTKQSW